MKLLSPILAILLIFVFSYGSYQALSYFPSSPPTGTPEHWNTGSPAPSPSPSPKLSYNQTLGLMLADADSEAVTAYNARLNRVYRSPLTISLKEGGTFTPLELPSSFLRSLIIPPTTSLDTPLQIDKDLLFNYLNNVLTKKQKEYFNPEATYQNVLAAISSRFHENATPTVLGVDDGPTSSGELAGRYLEVDLSQQKMYFFINNSLYKEYRISTGIDYPTPVGDYSIQNKTPLAFSDIYNV